MTLELAYVTETRHVHWKSAKLAYLIGRDTGHLLTMPTSPNSRLVTGLSERPQSDFELDLTIECVNGSVLLSSAMLGYLSRESYIKCVQANKMHVFTAVTQYIIYTLWMV
jgi:hypothetical protein